MLWIEGAGKSALFAAAGSGTEHRVRPEVQTLLDSGATVLGIDLLHQGEFLAAGATMTKTRLVKNQPIAAYTFGYNHALFAQRVHDILSAIKFVQASPAGNKSIALAGFGGAGPWVAAARAQAGGAIERAAIATGGFRFGKLLDIEDVNFLPGGAKYDDLPGLLALGAPHRLWLADEGAPPEVVDPLYRAAGAAQQLTCFAGAAAEARAAAARWLLASE